MGGPVLRRKLILEGPVRTADGAGGFSESWAALGALWADVTLRSGRRAEAFDVETSLTSYRITVRAAAPNAPSRPRPGQRFRDGSRLFAIDAVSDAGGRGHYLICYATEEGAV